MQPHKDALSAAPSACLPESRIAAACAILLPPLFCGTLAAWLGQPVDWDLRNYHWYNAWAFVTGRSTAGLDLMPAQIQSFLNPLIDVPYYLVATHVSPKAAGVMLGAVQGLNGVLLFMLAYLTLPLSGGRKTAAAALLAALGLAGAVGASEIGTTYGDNLASIGILATAVLVLRRGADITARDALFAAIPAGIAAGLKMTATLFCPGLAIGLFVFTRAPRVFIAFAVGGALGFLAAYAHWGWLLWEQYGSPTFPFFNAFFQSPLYPPVTWKDVGFLGPESFSPLFPFIFAAGSHLVSEAYWRDYRLPVLYTLAAVLLVLRIAMGKKAEKKEDMRPAHYLMILGATGYVWWWVYFCIYRYLLPLEMLVPLLIALCCALLPVRKTIQGALCALLLAGIAVTTRVADWGRLPGWRSHVAAVRVTPERDLNGALVLMTGVTPGAHIAAALPGGARYVRIEGIYFLPLDDDTQSTAMNARIAREIAAHDGSIYVLFPHNFPSHGRKGPEYALDYFGLNATGDCSVVEDLLYDPEPGLRNFPGYFRLCRVTH